MCDTSSQICSSVKCLALEAPLGQEAVQVPHPDRRPETAALQHGSERAIAAVVLGDSPDELTKENLNRAFRLILGGAELIGMHRNPWWLTPDGPTLDAGAFMVGLEWATGRRARDPAV